MLLVFSIELLDRCVIDYSDGVFFFLTSKLMQSSMTEEDNAKKCMLYDN